MDRGGPQLARGGPSLEIGDENTILYAGDPTRLHLSARVGVGLSKAETNLAHMSFSLPLPPLADLAITGFELTEVDSQPVVVESLEEA